MTAGSLAGATDDPARKNWGAGREPGGGGYIAPRAMNMLMVGHSFVVALNRRLSREVALAGGDRVRVTVVAPSFFHGDLRQIPLEPDGDEAYRLEKIPVRFSKRIHVFLYAHRLAGVLRRERWDVIHAWEEPYILAGGQIAYNTPGGAALIFHTFQNISKKYPLPFAQVERYAVKRAAGWVAGGQTIWENLKDRPGYRDRPAPRDLAGGRSRRLPA